MDFGETLQILAHSYRRRVLMTLLAHTPEDEGEITAMMADDDAAEFEALTLEMYHQHLPKLEAAGVIEWERNESLVRKGPTFEEVVPLLTLLRDHQEELSVQIA